MRYLFACLFILLVATGVYAQKIDSASIARLSPELRAEVNAHLLEAKQAQRTAITLAAGGGAVGLAGVIIVFVQMAKGYLGLFTLGTDPDLKYNKGVANAGLAMFIVGGGCALGSIPMFKKVHRSRNAARAIVFADRGVSLAPNVVLPGTQSLGMGVAISLGNRR